MKKRFIISTFCAGLVTIGCGYSLATSTKFPFLSLSSGEAYTFALDSDNTPNLTNVKKEQKEVVATGLSNHLYLNYSFASEVDGGHAKLAEGGYISNYEAINDITSLTVAGNGTFKLGYGIATITNYVSISLEDTSYTLTAVDMNYFKLVATSDDAVVTSISGADSCTTAAEYGEREYSTLAGGDVDKVTRFVHDVPTTQAFELKISFIQTSLYPTSNASSTNPYNPRLIVFDADAAYDENDDFVPATEKNLPTSKYVQFRQDWDVDNYTTGGVESNKISSSSANGASKSGVDGAFVGSNGAIFTTTWVCEEGKNPGKVIGSSNAGIGWRPYFWSDATVTVTATYTPAAASETLNTLDVQWHIEKTYENVDWAFNMHQYITFSDIENIGFCIGSFKCEWTVLDASFSEVSINE